MDLKIPIYQWIVTLIPGTIFLGVVFFLVQSSGIDYPELTLSGAVAPFIFLIFALVTGEVLQAISSFFEPLYFKTWGGKPSDNIFKNDNFKTELNALKNTLGCDDEEACFRGAMAIVNKDSLGRTVHFNILYSYMRSLLTTALLILVLTAYFYWAYAPVPLYVFVTEALVVIILWNRAKQRGYYYAKEVVTQAALAIK